MCGHLQYKPTQLSAEQLIDLLTEYRKIIPLIHAGEYYPGSTVDILVADQEPRVVPATWWFLLGADGKPNYKYATFNARRLDGRMWHEPIRTSRCVVLATAFGESIGEGKTKRSYLLEGDEIFLLGGLYRHYQTDAGPRTGFTVITRDPHPRLSKYHDKACPLFLPTDPDVVHEWLDPNVSASPLIQDLLDHPKLPTRFTVTPVKSTKKLEQVGPVEILDAD